MAQILLNDTLLSPQPSSAVWSVPVTGDNLDGTQTTGAYATFTISSPPIKKQFFNWPAFENQVLTSLTCYAPGDGPESNAVVYSAGVVSRKITTYQMPEDRTVKQVQLEILVVI